MGDHATVEVVIENDDLLLAVGDPLGFVAITAGELDSCLD